MAAVVWPLCRLVGLPADVAVVARLVLASLAPHGCGESDRREQDPNARGALFCEREREREGERERDINITTETYII